MIKGAIYEEIAQNSSYKFFTSYMTRYLVLGTYILNFFGTSGENDKNVLVKICKGINSWRSKSGRVYFHAILRINFQDLESGPHTPVNIKSNASPGYLGNKK